MNGRRRWYDAGVDPDRRYSMANERTFLAWTRTSLALIAGAVAVVQFVPPFAVAGARLALGLALAVTGVGAAGLGYARWKASEVALRQDRRPPRPRPVQLLAGAVALIGTLVVLLAVADAAHTSSPALSLLELRGWTFPGRVTDFGSVQERRTADIPCLSDVAGSAHRRGDDVQRIQTNEGIGGDMSTTVNGNGPGSAVRVSFGRVRVARP